VSKNQKELLFKVAKLYYEENKTQAEIGHIVHASRSTVSRLLLKARDEGVVEISLKYPWERDFALEKVFLEQFKLKELVILKSYGQSHREIIRGLGFLAAEFLNQIIQEGDIISCSYGRTVASTIQALNPSRRLNITVVQMIGALGVENPFMDGPDLVRLLAEKYQGDYRYLLGPLVVKNAEIRDALINQMRYQQTLALSRSAQIGLCGIGGMVEKTPSPIWQNYIDEEEWKDLIKMGARGHFAANFLNKDGLILDADINTRVLGLSLLDLRKIPNMIAVAGGIQKATAIHSALKGRHMNILITDDSAAQEILKYRKDEED
jgi:deoxyribonucleoside regulator